MKTIDQLETLSLPERIQLVEDLWDSIARSAAPLPVPDWHKRELARRKDRYVREPKSAVTWEQAKGSILERET